MRVTRLGVIAAATMALVPAVSRAGQDVFVSEGVQGRNGSPVAAVNESNGDVLVAWVRRESVDGIPKGRIWTRLLIRDADGSYQLGQARQISPSEGDHSAPSVAWVPRKRLFFVAWHTQDLVTLNTSEVLGRLLKQKTGKPKGGVKTIASNESHNTWPFVTAELANGKPRINLLYSRRDAEAPSSAARVAAGGAGAVSNFVAATLNTKLASIGDELVLVHGESTSVRTVADSFLGFVAQRKQDIRVVFGTTVGSPPQAAIFVFVDGALVNKVVLAGAEPGEFGVAVGGWVSANTSGGSVRAGFQRNGQYFTQLFVADSGWGSLEALGDPQPWGEADAWDIMRGQSGSDDQSAQRALAAGYVVQADEQWTELQAMDENMAPLGGTVQLFAHEGRMEDLRAYLLGTAGSARPRQDGPDALVLWRRDISDLVPQQGAAEIRAWLYRIDEAAARGRSRFTAPAASMATRSARIASTHSDR